VRPPFSQNATHDVTEEIIKIRTKPNAFLYASEALRLFFVSALAITLVLLPVAHLRTGLPIAGLMLRIALTVYCTFACFFFVFVFFLACCTEFIVTDKRVIVRRTLIGRMCDKISIPIESIVTVELRSYSAYYGSVYFIWDQAVRTRRIANLVVKRGWAAAWLSMPSTSPALSGFYGFRDFDGFAKLILEQQAKLLDFQ
jgi:hypothetical protein